MFTLNTKIKSAILLVSLLLPYFIFRQYNLLEKKSESKLDGCISNYKNERQLCVTCVHRNKLDISFNSQILISAKGSQFLAVKIPSNPILSCVQILYMIQSEKIDQIQSLADLKLENIESIKQLTQYLKFELQLSEENTLLIDQNINQIAVVSLKTRGIPYTIKNITYIPKSLQNALRIYIKKVSYLSFIVGCIFLALRLIQQNKKWHELLISLIILIMVIYSERQENLSKSTDLLSFKYARILFYALMFVKIGISKPISIAVMLSFSLLIFTQYQFYAIVACFLLFLFSMIDGMKQKKGINDYYFTGICFTVLLANLWLKKQKQFNFITLNILLQYGLLIYGVILSQSQPKIDQKYEKLPANSELSLPGFQQNINDEQND